MPIRSSASRRRAPRTSSPRSWSPSAWRCIAAWARPASSPRSAVGNSPRAIGLRADMDALPIHEENGFDHRSRHDGKMHACGHDGHTTMLLGAARYLCATRNFDGCVHFIFQPAEEGLGGARAMIERRPVRAVPDGGGLRHAQPRRPAGRRASPIRAGPDDGGRGLLRHRYHRRRRARRAARAQRRPDGGRRRRSSRRCRPIVSRNARPPTRSWSRSPRSTAATPTT